MASGSPDDFGAIDDSRLRDPLTAPIGVGILGFGSIGAVHLQALRDREDARLVAVSRRTRIPAPAPGVALHTDYCELLARPDVDVVVICTPSGTHAEHVRAALDHGKHVVVEKPITLAAADARRLAQEAHARRLMLAPISQRRFEPQNAGIKALIDAGALGKPVLGEALVRWYRSAEYYQAAHWRGTPEGDGGVLLNQGLHAIDLLCWFFGKCRAAYGIAATLTHAIAAEDTVAAALQFESEALGVLAVTTSAPPGLSEELNLFFDRGNVLLRGSLVTQWGFADVPPPAQLHRQRGSGASDPMAIGADGHRAQWDDIIAALKAGRQPTVTVDSAVATLEAIEQVRAS